MLNKDSFLVYCGVVLTCTAILSFFTYVGIKHGVKEEPQYCTWVYINAEDDVNSNKRIQVIPTEDGLVALIAC